MRIAIYGYGHVGRGAELAVRAAPDLTLGGIFTRRDPAKLQKECTVPVYPAREFLQRAEEFDVTILCCGSAEDLPELTPRLAGIGNVVDSFDVHPRAGAHFTAVDRAARDSGHTALIAGGWDPGLFSLFRGLCQALLPEGSGNTFWGPGISQGHSQAIRTLPGVLDARQYTIPREEALEAARRGQGPLTPAEMHRRVCYVAAAPEAEQEELRRQIVSLPYYFAPYETTVTFVSQEELQRDHGGMPHGGQVLYSGRTGSHRQQMSLSLQLESNPEFTGSLLAALARAVGRMHRRGEVGCKTVFDVTAADLSPLTEEELRTRFL